MRYFVSICLWIVSCHLTVLAQDDSIDDSNAIETNSFWDNWYGQVGVDMNLFFPYGCNVKEVFPNGKSFGLSAAVGKWFTPEFGGRLKLNWENGLIKTIMTGCRQAILVIIIGMVVLLLLLVTSALISIICLVSIILTGSGI
jgi:hypothetical protein